MTDFKYKICKGPLCEDTSSGCALLGRCTINEDDNAVNAEVAALLAAEVEFLSTPYFDSEGNEGTIDEVTTS